jgi:hypothetical protein
MNIERNASFFWLDGHEIEDSLRVESMTINLERLYADIQALIRFLWSCQTNSTVVRCEIRLT